MAHDPWQTQLRGLSLSTLILLAAACAGPANPAGMASPPAGEPRRPSNAAIQEAYGRLPLYFEENRGQAAADVRYVARTPGGAVALAPGQVRLHAEHRTVTLSFEGASATAALEAIDPLPGRVNYLRGRDPRRWHTGIPTYERVRAAAIYPGIDVVFYGSQRELEYDFVVAPGADPGRIGLRVTGADRLELTSDGDLNIHMGARVVVHRAPVLYQERDGRRVPVEGGYVRRGTDRAIIRVGAYDRRRPLVIDPVVSYATYLGGGGQDTGHAIAVDSAGHAYIAGATTSTDFPVTAGPQPMKSGGADAFVAKLDSTGTGLVYATYLGGTLDDAAHAIAVDGAGNAHVGGTTASTDFPTVNAAQSALAGGGATDAFVAKLDASGSSLAYATYLGGPPSAGNVGADAARGIAVDASGNVFVAGETTSAAFPTTSGTFQPNGGGGGDAFVAKVSPTGAIAYATRLGGSAVDAGRGIAVDGSGSAYVVGTTQSTNFPTTPGGFQTTNPFAGNSIGSFQTAFVTKLDPDGASLVYSTYLGGGSNDLGLAIAVANGFAHVAGTTDSPDFPTLNAFQPSNADGQGGANNCCFDAFVTKLNQAGSALVFSTYLGRKGADVALGIAVDAAGGVYATGFTTPAGAGATGFPTKDAIHPFGPADSGVFLVKFDTSGGLVYSTSVGQPSPTLILGNPIAVDPAANVFVTGVGALFAATAGAFQPAPAGGGDAAVLKIAPGGNGGVGPTPPTVAISAPAHGAWIGTGVRVTVTASDDVGVADIEVWGAGAVVGTVTCGGPTCSGETWFDTTGKPDGAYQLNAVATDTAGNQTISATVTLNREATSPVFPSGVTTGGGGDTTAPTVTMTGPTQGSTATGTVTVSATASDNVGVSHVQFTLDGANLGSADATAPYSVTWNTTTAANGSHTLSAVATDAAGNTTASAPITVTVSNASGGGGDTTKPTVTITSPTNGAAVGDSVNVRVTASDDVGLAAIKLWGAGGVFGTLTCSGTTCSGLVPFKTKGQPNGAYEINAVATDTAGNQTISATVKVNKRATSPVFASGVHDVAAGSVQP